MYSLSSKVFMCTTCVPNKKIKRLVGADVLTAMCEDCNTQAHLKDPPISTPVKPVSRAGNRPMPGIRGSNLANSG
jgi:hypothetical protein